jgi:hypothetical protein
MVGSFDPTIQRLVGPRHLARAKAGSRLGVAGVITDIVSIGPTGIDLCRFGKYQDATAAGTAPSSRVWWFDGKNWHARSGTRRIPSQCRAQRLSAVSGIISMSEPISACGSYEPPRTAAECTRFRSEANPRQEINSMRSNAT